MYNVHFGGKRINKNTKKDLLSMPSTGKDGKSYPFKTLYINENPLIQPVISDE